MNRLFLFHLSFVLMAVSADTSKMTIDIKERVMRDTKGRHTIFHGVNVVYKIAPYIPERQAFDAQNSLNDQDIDDLVSWGFNFVRLGVMWEAVETSPGNYNSTYI
jgi:endoglycosylceramidase